jgi:tetratricopeptide (TPR) repeat protein
VNSGRRKRASAALCGKTRQAGKKTEGSARTKWPRAFELPLLGSSRRPSPKRKRPLLSMVGAPGGGAILDQQFRAGAGGGASEFTINFHERFARPELLYQLGREDEALPWYRSLAYDLLYTGPAELRQGQIYEHRGDRQRAIEHYSRFLELWRDSDPALQPLVQQARDALARLR